LRRRIATGWGGLAAIALAGCRAGHDQSVLHPAATPAAHIAWLWWAMLGVLGAVTVAVFVLLALAVGRRAGASPPGGASRFVVVGGLVMPALILVPLLVASLVTSRALQRPETDLTIEVIGHMWWWEVRYPDDGIVTANELVVPAGRPVRLVLSAKDVIHSFWVPSLHGKMDLLPDHPNTFWIEAARPGRYRGQCAEFCGVQHARMAFHVEALAPAAFAAWRAARAKPLPAPASPVTARGREVFRATGCGACHAIRGLSTGTQGPDLTHMGSRPSVGAGTRPNTPDELARWIRDPQADKPGNHMPASALSEADLQAVAAYLASLK
jgi:cytochrome c oxidase subunit 2